MKASLRANGPYSLKSVVLSHGWGDLRPFRVRNTDGVTHVALRTAKGPKSYLVKPSKNGVVLEGDFIDDVVRRDIRWMFRLDDDLAAFYERMGKEDRAFICDLKMGRLLRSQTVFEDLIKLVLTTNCSWSLTRAMADRMCERLGERTEDGQLLFPSPETLVQQNEKFYRTEIRTGYRAPHFPKLALSALGEETSPERWKAATLATEQIREEVLAMPGAGPYVADNLLRFLGRGDYLGLDSWARGKLKEMWAMRKIPSDKTVARKYKMFGDQRGLVLWCDLTRDWFEREDWGDWIRKSDPLPTEPLCIEVLS